jgi:hypothetical protein
MFKKSCALKFNSKDNQESDFLVPRVNRAVKNEGGRNLFYLSVMGIVRLFFLLLAATSVIFLVIGLFRPWAMLWWEDIQNRRKVIKVYGTVAVLCYAVYWGLYFFA